MEGSQGEDEEELVQEEITDSDFDEIEASPDVHALDQSNNMTF